MAKIKKINHIGVAVTDIQAALSFWQSTLGIQLDHTEEAPEQKVKVAFLPVGDSEIELVQPTSADSSTSKFINERGGGIHHLCLEVDDIVGMLSQLKAKGILLINEEPVQMEGRKIAFVHPKSTGGVLLEMYQLDK
jgi:methylmalonyl-CoA/ethylmalonyl-CoA epimerase